MIYKGEAFTATVILVLILVLILLISTLNKPRLREYTLCYVNFLASLYSSPEIGKLPSNNDLSASEQAAQQKIYNMHQNTINNHQRIVVMELQLQ